MRSKYSNIAIVVAAILAFLPVVCVSGLLDMYVRMQTDAAMQQQVDSVASDVASSANAAMSSIDKVLTDSPSLCTPTFIANVYRAMQSSLLLRNMIVEGPGGIQYCNAFGGTTNYTQVSEGLSIPGRTETMSIVRLDGLSLPVLKVTRPYGAERRVSALVPVLAGNISDLLSRLAPAGLFRVSLTDGTPVITIGDAARFDRDHTGDLIDVQALVGEYPLRVEAIAPMGAVWARYAGVAAAITLATCAVSALLLVMILRYVRRSALPAFDLERAIALGEIKPFYQPVIDLGTGRLLGCEVLCRWIKKNGEMIPPGVFIDYAEASDLALPMTVSLMQQVRRDLADLSREMPRLKISINLFEGHFRDTSIIDDVRAIFDDSSISFSQLTFEITERRPLGNSTRAHAVIAGLHALGAKLALDDVGTGHSNLAYLQTLGVDIIKIDHVFVDMVKPETTQVPVLDGLIAMARDLGTEVVAEGVETEAQAIYLRTRGVVQAQGFLFAPALRATSFKDLARALNAVSPPLAEADSDGVADAA